MGSFCASARMSSFKASSAGEPGRGGGGGDMMARRTVPESAPTRKRMVAETQRGRRRGVFGGGEVVVVGVGVGNGDAGDDDDGGGGGDGGADDADAEVAIGEDGSS